MINTSMNLPENEILSLGFAERSENILWRFDEQSFSSRANAKQKFSRILAPVSRELFSFGEEAVLAAKKIQDRSSGKITVLASGGSDSEAAMRSFLKAGVPFEIVAIDFSSVNRDELSYLDHFCRLYGLKFKTIHLDIKKFWENELESVALKSGSVSPQICALLHVIQQIDEYVVIGDGEVDIFQQSARFYDTWGEKWAYAPWMLKIHHPGCPAFFSFTAELEASMYFDPIVEDFVNEGWAYVGQSRFQFVKPFLYYHHFGLRFRPKIDIFQPLRALDLEWRMFLSKKMPGADSYFSIEYNLIKEMKIGNFGSLRRQVIPLSELSPFDQERFVMPMSEGEHLIMRGT